MTKEQFIVLLAEILRDFYKRYGNIGKTGFSGFRLFYQYIIDEAERIEYERR